MQSDHHALFQLEPSRVGEIRQVFINSNPVPKAFGQDKTEVMGASLCHRLNNRSGLTHAQETSGLSQDGLRRIRKAADRLLGWAYLDQDPNLCPITIGKGSFGENTDKIAVAQDPFSRESATKGPQFNKRQFSTFPVERVMDNSCCFAFAHSRANAAAKSFKRSLKHPNRDRRRRNILGGFFGFQTCHRMIHILEQITTRRNFSVLVCGRRPAGKANSGSHGLRHTQCQLIAEKRNAGAIRGLEL